MRVVVVDGPVTRLLVLALVRYDFGAQGDAGKVPQRARSLAVHRVQSWGRCWML